MLTQQGYIVPETTADIGKVKRELTVSPIDFSGLQHRQRQFPVYWHDTNKLIIPKYYGLNALGRAREHFGMVQPFRGAFEGSLKQELDQPAAVAATLRSMRQCGGAVLSLSTGAGKTVCTCYIIAQLAVKTVVLVHKDVLRLQWAERIAQFLPTAKVSFVQGTSVDTSGDIVIAMIQTLVSPGRHFDFSGIGLVVSDEAHHIAAETFSTAMRGLCTPYSLGLSATPDRKDGLTRVIYWFLGPLAYASQRTEQKHVRVKIVRYTCPQYTERPPMSRTGMVNFTQVITNMTDDRMRTKQILDEIKWLREDPERVVLVLSHRRDHCIEIASQIEGAVAFLGGKKNHAAAAATAPVVCATYALASEGYDDPRLNALVLATPCSDVTQAAGRVLRGVSTKDPIIIDINDDFSVAYAQAAKRKTFYRKAGFKYFEEKKEYPRCIIID